MRSIRGRVVAFVAVGALVASIVGVGGCGDDEATSAPLSQLSAEAGGACSAGAKECVNEKLARVCPNDGSAWLAIPCGDGERCIDGACAIDMGSRCPPGDGKCLSSNLGVRCADDGSAYQQVTCPANTLCFGAGQCRGACVVGAGSCLDVHTVKTCTDGQTENITTCGAGELCVETYPGRAACKPAECTPDPFGCTAECGNRVNAGADATKYVSTCVATPQGYKWRAAECQAGQTCNPTANGTCSNGRGRAACTSTCTPGAQRCAPGLNGHQTCGADGKWEAAVTLCNPTPTGSDLVCMTSGSDPKKVVCGDRICAAGHEGTCDASGTIRKCGPDGKLAPVATACTTGTCQATGAASIDGHAPGRCIAACQAGDERCVFTTGNAYQACANNGLWGTAVTCPNQADGSITRCYSYTSTTGRPAKLCGGECTPGKHRCATGSEIQTCDAAGKWGPATACTLGRCTTSGSDAICAADCVPGATVCIGGTIATDVPGRTGTSASATCPANGLMPTAPTCPGGAGCCEAGTACRKSGTGHALGCVKCVGSGVTGGNEAGEVDSRCVADDGGAGSNATQVCAANNTWGTPSACPTGSTCTTGTFVCADSDTTHRANTGHGCDVHGWVPLVQCGATPDCCNGFCSATGGYGAAVCR